MKFFFSLFKDKDTNELESLEKDEYEYCYVSVPKGVDRKKLIKSVKKLRNKILICPVNLSLYSQKTPWETLTSTEVVDLLLEDNTEHTPLCIPKNIWENDTGHNTWFSFNGLKFHKPNYSNDYGGSAEQTPFEKISKRIRNTWLEVQIKKGNISYECEECEDHLEKLTKDFECPNCHCDVLMFGKKQPTPIKMYREILEYEEKTGRPFLDRVA